MHCKGCSMYILDQSFSIKQNGSSVFHIYVPLKYSMYVYKSLINCCHLSVLLAGYLLVFKTFKRLVML